MAQAGLPAPAESARIGVVDRLFSRVGAADDLARGRSTFMVEMTETAAILHQAGPRSLVIVDEIGRGTGTLDGLAIAWAVLEALHGQNRCRTVFATHFHELGQLAAHLPRLRPCTMRVKEWRGSVVFLHEVAEGAAGRSWGVHVAQLAGVPQATVRRAAALLNALGEKPPWQPGRAAAVRRRRSRTRLIGPAPPRSTQGSAARARARPSHAAGRRGNSLSYQSTCCCSRGSYGCSIVIMSNPLPLPDRPEEAIKLLDSALRGIASAGRSPPRDAALSSFRRYLGRVQHHVQERFEAGGMSGLEAGRLLGRLMDGVIGSLHDYARASAWPPADADDAVQRPTQAMAVVATGGYGRGVLAPFSDIDLLFITEERPTAPTFAVVEFMLYFLWDLGLKVGHATRSINECIAEAERDLTIRTSMIDARLLAGAAGLFEPFMERFLQSCADAGAGGFIAAKQAERDARHHRYGETPFLVEPNIKEGRGGLRDLQTLYWMTRYVFGTQVMGELVGPDSPGGGILNHQEAKHARRSWDFLWTVRFHLHYVAGRAEDRLTFDLQPVVGARMGYTRHGRQDGVERFMRHYFLTAREITRITTVLEPAVVRAALGPPARGRRDRRGAAGAGLRARRGQADVRARQ